MKKLLNLLFVFSVISNMQAAITEEDLLNKELLHFNEIKKWMQPLLKYYRNIYYYNEFNPAAIEFIKNLTGDKKATLKEKASNAKTKITGPTSMAGNLLSRLDAIIELCNEAPAPAPSPAPAPVPVPVPNHTVRNGLIFVGVVVTVLTAYAKRVTIASWFKKSAPADEPAAQDAQDAALAPQSVENSDVTAAA